jgi:tape measure domain-containing protein
MSVIKSNDIVDFDGTYRDIDKLEQRFLSYGKVAVSMIEKITEARERDIQVARQQAAEMKSSRGGGGGGGFGNLTKDIDKSIASIEKYNATLKTMNDFESIAELSIKELREGVAALQKQYDSLKPSASGFKEDQTAVAVRIKVATDQIHYQESALKALTTAVKISNTAVKEAKKVIEAAEGSYAKLNKETIELKKQLRDLPGAFNLATGAINKNNAQAVIWQKTIERNDNALKKMDASMGNHQRNVGNYSSAFKGLNLSISGLIAPILGVSTAYEALSKSIQIIDQMTRLKLGLEAVSSSSAQVARRWQFLATLADRTGQDVEKLTENYISFAGAARNTSLEGAKGDAIFRAFSNSFSALGKSSEVANRGLYAVQQMISKTKVNSEELNQQLAEALPGANKLFADALGVSTAKLADMMKKGEVLAIDVLPKVAAALEKTYGERAQKNIETITGSWNRLTTQFKLFLDDLNKDSAISGFFAKLNNGIADAIRNFGALRTSGKDVLGRAELLGQNMSPGAKLAGSFVPGLNQGRNVMSATQQIGNENANIQSQVNKVQAIADNKRRIDIIMREGQELKKVTTALKDWEDQTKNTVLRTEEMRARTVNLNIAVDRQRRLVEALGQAEIKRASTAKEVTPVGDPASAGSGASNGSGGAGRVLTQFEKLTKEAEKVRGIIIDDLLADQAAGRALEPSDESVEKFNKIYERLREINEIIGNELPSNLTELYDKINKTPENIVNQIPIENLSGDDSAASSKSGSGGMVDLTKWNALLKVHEEEQQLLKNKAGEYGILKYISNEYTTQLMEQLKEIQALEKQSSIEQVESKKQAINEEIQLEKQKYQQIMELARLEAQGKRELQQAAWDLALESSNAIFQIAQDQRAADIEANQMAMQHELSLVQGNEAAQERIKKEYAKKDLELRQKQARLEKAQAAFSIGISTARAVVNALATGGPPWIGIALAAIVGAMGAVQLAAVLAKPLPQFYKGTDNAPEGPAWVAERGPEIIESRGKRSLVSSKSIVPLKQGDKVYTAAETRAILSGSARGAGIDSVLSRGIASERNRAEIAAAQAIMMSRNNGPSIDYDKMTSTFTKALDSRPVNQTFVDEQGIRRRHIRQNSTTTYNNSRYSLLKP